MSKSSFPSKLLWMDLEMTGLDPQEDRIVEVGVIITDFTFKELDTFTAVVKQDDATLGRMKSAAWYEWNGGTRTKIGTVYDMAQKNGLLDKVAQGQDESAVEQQIMELVHKHFNQPAILAGNSIHQDRRFIRVWWQRLEAILHYRMLDVTAFKIWMQGARAQEYQSEDKHRALDDIRGSIKELQYYLDKLSKTKS